MLKIEHLTKRYGEKVAVDDLSLHIAPGEICAFIGHNGAGKTTAIKSVCGILRFDAGEIFVAGEKVTYGQIATNRHIGYLPDVPEFYPFMTACEYLTFCGEILGMEKSLINERCDELLTLVGLKKERHRIKGFSRGMTQRLGIAQALFGRPALLICDEPTSALDPVGRKEILDILVSASRETTVIFSTHILSDVERICTDVAFLNNGVIEIFGKVSDIKKKYRTDEYIVEADSADATSRLAEKFPKMRKSSGTALSFNTADHSPHDVMRYIADNALPIQRLERAEPGLESLFLEVTGK